MFLGWMLEEMEAQSKLERRRKTAVSFWWTITLEAKRKILSLGGRWREWQRCCWSHTVRKNDRRLKRSAALVENEAHRGIRFDAFSESVLDNQWIIPAPKDQMLALFGIVVAPYEKEVNSMMLMKSLPVRETLTLHRSSKNIRAQLQTFHNSKLSLA